MSSDENATCPSCGRQVERKGMYKNDPCEVCSAYVCYECIRRKQVLPPSWELPAGAFKYRCKRHLGAPLGLGWQAVPRTLAAR